jgi:hypothetical protein
VLFTPRLVDRLSEVTDLQTSDQDESTYSNGRSYIGTRKYGVLLERSSYSPKTPPVTIGFLERYAAGCEVEDGRKGGRHHVSIAKGMHRLYTACCGWMTTVSRGVKVRPARSARRL